jgi:hypothetical protein
MANNSVWSPGEKAAATGLAGALLGGVTTAIISLLNSEIDKENRESNK